MSSRRFAIIDPAAGISGDMLLGALVDLSGSADWLQSLPGRLGIPDAGIEVATVDRCGVRAVKVTVRVGGAVEEPRDVAADEHHHHDHEHHHHHHDPGHSHGHHGPHRHVGELLQRIADAPLSSPVRDKAAAAFRLLAQAEGRVHGVEPDDVALHEVGAWDALVDIVGAIEGFERLGVDRVFTRPVAVGHGWVRAAHGVLPIPAPATTHLLEGLVVAQDGPVEGEATTPTGAALLRVLAEPVDPGPWRALAAGFGAGARNPGQYPNALTVRLVEPVTVEAGDMAVLATDLDDLSPEYLEPLREALTAAGAVDVQCWATQMKKGRIGFRVEATAPMDAVPALADACFRHSTTAGVRWWPVRRTILDREAWDLEGEAGRVRVKTLHAPDGPRVKPEYDDVVAESRRTGQPAHVISRRLQEEALRRVRIARAAREDAGNAQTKE